MTENKLKHIDVHGKEDWREYDFDGRVYRINNPVSIYYSPGSSTHRVTDEQGVTHIVPAPANSGCVIRFRGEVIA